MHTVSVLLLLVTSQAAPGGGPDIDTGMRLVYSGHLTPARGDQAGGRRFRMHYLARAASKDSGYEVAWVLDAGNLEGGSTWPNRFGTMSVARSLVVNDQELPTIRGEHDRMVRAISLPFPFFPDADRLRTDAEWSDRGLQFSVVGREAIGTRQCWKVSASSNQSVRSIDWVSDERPPTIVRHQELVFLGQGVPYELRLELDEVAALSSQDVTHAFTHHARLLALRETGKPSRSEEEGHAVPATDRLLALARDALQTIEKEQKESLHAALARGIVRELEAGVDQQNAVARLAAALIGKPAAAVSVPLVRGGRASLEDFRGNVVVLHFWDYHADPLTAPYGEAGYLDYLARKHADQPLRVLGIAVDRRLEEESTRPVAQREIRAFCDFMNLSYPIGLGAGGVIDRYGDPRRAGGKLPLYVVIDRDGNIAAYHAGLWSKAGDEGLRELEGEIDKLVSKQGSR